MDTTFSDLPFTADDVTAAKARIDGALVHTPCTRSHVLSRRFEADIYVKYENRQVTGAYKERGALNKLLSLSEAEQKAGVIAMSAGNHAQGLAYHAARLGVPAVIVMPEDTPFVKVRATKDFGADVVLHGSGLDDATAYAHELADRKGYTFVHPFDDPVVMAGQGTVALEMFEDVPDLDTLIIPVGGGGLITGCAVAAKAANPAVQVIGVEPELYPSLTNAMHHEEADCGGTTIAEGISVTKLGGTATAMLAGLIDQAVTVPEEQMERAIALFASAEHTIAEGAGAAGLACLMEYPEDYKGRKIGLVLTGGNIDARVLSSVLVRELLRDGRVTTLSVEMPDRPGGLKTVAAICADEGANVLEVAHNRRALDLSVKAARLDITFETRDAEHSDQVIRQIKAAGFTITGMEADGI